MLAGRPTNSSQIRRRPPHPFSIFDSFLEVVASQLGMRFLELESFRVRCRVKIGTSDWGLGDGENCEYNKHMS